MFIIICMGSCAKVARLLYHAGSTMMSWCLHLVLTLIFDLSLLLVALFHMDLHMNTSINRLQMHSTKQGWLVLSKVSKLKTFTQTLAFAGLTVTALLVISFWFWICSMLNFTERDRKRCVILSFSFSVLLSKESVLTSVSLCRYQGGKPCVVNWAE